METKSDGSMETASAKVVGDVIGEVLQQAIEVKLSREKVRQGLDVMIVRAVPDLRTLVGEETLTIRVRIAEPHSGGIVATWTTAEVRK